MKSHLLLLFVLSGVLSGCSEAHGSRGVFGKNTFVVGDTPYQAAVKANSPTYWWWANDASGNMVDHADANPAVVSGVIVYQQPTLVAGESFSILQTGPGIFFTITPVSLTGDFSLEWWFKEASVPVGYSPFWLPAASDHPAVYWFNGNLDVVDTNNVVCAHATNTNNTNTHYAVVTRSGTTVKIYVDGSDSTTGAVAWSGSLTFTIKFILHDSTAGNNSVNWQMGAIYVGTVLTSTDVTNHWNAGH